MYLATELNDSNTLRVVIGMARVRCSFSILNETIIDDSSGFLELRKRSSRLIAQLTVYAREYTENWLVIQPGLQGII